MMMSENGTEQQKGAADNHWLERPETIRKLKLGGIALLVFIVLCDLIVHHHPYFDFDGTFGFAAVYGFASCVVLVLLAYVIGKLLKRPEDYYDQ